MTVPFPSNNNVVINGGDEIYEQSLICNLYNNDWVTSLVYFLVCQKRIITVALDHPVPA